MWSNLPKADLFPGKSISRFPNHVMQKHVASGNNGHLFYAFDASTNSELAFKIVPVDNLPRNPDDQYAYLNEAKKANLLMHPAVVGCVDVVPYTGPCSSSEEIGECVVFVYHYVKGMNLRAYMKEHRSDINLPFIEHFLRTMLELLYELQQRGEQHGDLHAGNVLVAQSEFDIYNRTTFRVTDFGVRKLTGHAAHASDYLYTTDTLRQLLMWTDLGSIPRNENATARALRQNEGQENYAGCQTVAAMCSGDIHYMIRLVNGMVEDYGGRDRLAASDGTPRIPPRRQHNSIRAAAGTVMESVRTLPQWGTRLADVVTAFGNVVHSYLMYETAKNETSEPPHQASRIEPYEALHLSDDAQEILNELLWYSVLIEDPRGMSRRGKIVPRYYLRRYLIPHFRLTFSRRDSLELENDQIETLLCKPQQFEDAMRLKSEEDAARRRRRDQNQNQTELFQEE